MVTKETKGKRQLTQRFPWAALEAGQDLNRKVGAVLSGGRNGHRKPTNESKGPSHELH